MIDNEARPRLKVLSSTAKKFMAPNAVRSVDHNQLATKAPFLQKMTSDATVRPGWSRERHSATVVREGKTAHGVKFSADRMVFGANARQQELVMGQEIDRIFNSTSLDDLPAGAMIGKGNFKDCYEIKGTDNALIVNQKYSSSMKEELVTLFRLQKMGIPVVPILGIGKFRGEEAMVQPRLRHMLKFKESASPGFDLLKTGIANRNTIDSLKNLRDVIRRNGVVIGDLQGGLDSDPRSANFGAFLVNDPLGIDKATNSPFEGFSNIEQIRELDTAIALLEQVIR